MKKFLSILIACTMLFACFSLTSCNMILDLINKDDGSISAEDIVENPSVVLAQTIENTMNAFFTPNENVQKNITNALNKGAIGIHFASSDLLDESLTVDETIYTDKSNNKYVSDTSVIYGADSYAGRIFVDQTGAAVQGSDILGTDGTYFINFSTLLENIQGSALADALELTDEDIAMFETIKESYDKLFAEQEQQAVDLNKLILTLDMQVATEELDGNEVVTVTLNINNTTIINFLTAALEDFDQSVSINEEISVDELISSVKEALEDITINVENKFYINAKENKLVKQTLNAAVTEEYYDFYGPVTQTYNVNGTMTYSSDAIRTDVTVNLGDEDSKDINVKVDLTKNSSASELSYNLVANASFDSISLEVVNANITFNRLNGDFNLNAEVSTDIEDTYKVSLDGNIKNEGQKTTISVNQVKYNKVAVKFDLSLSFEATDKIPERPADAKDIVLLTESELESLVESIKYSKIAKLF